MNLSSENARAMLIEHITNKKIHVGDGSTADSVFAQWAKIAEVVTDTMKTKKLYADEIDVGEITADNALLKYLQCVDGVFQTITSDAVNTHIMSADEVDAAIGTFIELNTDKLFADYIKATDIVSETITVDQLFGVAAKFFSMIAETVTATGIVSYKIDSEHLNIKDAFIKDAMIDTLSAGKIKSGSLDTGLVTVQSSDGRLKIQDNTLLISDAKHTRVQIGKDATGDYNMILCDASGKVMWNAAGLQPDAIKAAIIVDDMVSDTANINAKKLDISSIITAVNADTTKINATSIVVDADNQTLSAWFKSTEDWKSEKAEEYTQLESKYEAVNGRFENYLSKTEFVDTSNDVAELKNQYTDLKQTTGSMALTISQTSSSLSALSDNLKNNYLTSENTTAAITANNASIKSEVSKTVFDNLSIGGRNLLLNTAKTELSGALAWGTKGSIQLKGCNNQSYNSGVANGNMIEPKEHGYRVYVGEATYATYWINGYGQGLNGGIGCLKKGLTYTISFDWSVKAYSADTSDTEQHIQLAIYGNHVDTDTFNAIFRYNFVKIPKVMKGKVLTGRCEYTFTIPESETLSYIVLRLLFPVESVHSSDDFLEFSDIKLEDGNKATDWTPAPEDIDETYTPKKSIISVINQTAETVKIAASKIDITGAVSFNSFDAALQSNMTTVTNAVNSWGYSTDKTYIDGSKIYTGTITADKIAAGAITADKIVVGESDNLITVNPTIASTLKPLDSCPKYGTSYETGYGFYFYQTNGVLPLSSMQPWIFHAKDQLYFDLTVPNWSAKDVPAWLSLWAFDSNKQDISETQVPCTLKKQAWNKIKATLTVPDFSETNKPYYYVIGIHKAKGYDSVKLGVVLGAVCKRKVNGQLIVNGSITATQIAAGSITADKLKVTDLKAIGATIGGFTIGATYIANGVSKIYDASKTEYVYVGTDGISCGPGFRVTKTGKLVLASTVMSSTTGGTRTAICTVQSDKYYTKIYPNGLESWNAKDNYYAFIHPDQIGFFEYNSKNGKFECHTWLGSGNAIIGNQLHVQGICYCAKDLEVSGKLKVYNTSGIELYGTVPYIDFHYNNGGADYTARIIAEATNALTLVGGNGIRCATSVGNGYIMHGRDNYSHKYGVSWDGTLHFYVDSTNVGNISDRRLKKDIKPMHDAYLQAVGAVDIVQYRIDRTIYNDDINFGAIAQDLRKSFTDHGLCPDDYKLLGTMQDTMDDPTLYYTIDYEQFLIARVAYDEKRTDNLEQQLKDYKSDNAILRMQLQQLQHQLDALTVKVNAE